MASRQQNSTSNPISFFMADSTDHVTGKTGLSPTVTLSKDGGSFAAASGTVSEIGNGYYKLAGNATDRNTLGECILRATGTGADDGGRIFDITPSNPFDTRHERAVDGIVLGTVTTGATSTSIPTSSLDPAASATDQFKGRIVTFNRNTTTAALRGQSTDITASTAGGTLTVTALSTSPANGDTFTIQ